MPNHNTGIEMAASAAAIVIVSRSSSPGRGAGQSEYESRLLLRYQQLQGTSDCKAASNEC